MRVVTLQKISIESFKSFKTLTVVKLSTKEGFKLLGGLNVAQPRLGANGAGKSSLWDAVLWCFYGLGAKGQRAQELTTWGASKPTVTCITSINGVTYVIKRVGNPNKLFINDEPAEQIDVERLLGLSRMRFQHSVIFGQSIRLFPDLLMSERADLLEQVCDLGLWMRATQEVTDEFNVLEVDRNNVMRDAANSEGQLKGIRDTNLLALQEQADDWEVQREHDRRLIKHQLRQSVQTYNDAVDLVTESEQRIKDAGGTSELDGRIRDGRAHIKRLESTITIEKSDGRRDIDEIAYLTHSSKCDKCGQKITAEFRYERLEHLQRSTQERLNRLEEHNNKYEKFRAAVITLTVNRDAAILLLGTLQAARKHAIERLADKQQENEALEKRFSQLSTDVDNPFVSRLLSLQKLEQKAEKALNDSLRIQRRIQSHIAQLDYWKTGFKKVRLFLIERVLEYLTIETEAAAQALGLKGWTIQYVTEIENKSGTMKPGVQIIISSPSATGTWESWSGGEGQRIRLAVALGLAFLIQQMAGVNYTWEVYDEPSNWLSEEGIDDMLAHFKYRADTLHKSIWLVDHRSLNAGSFDEIWRATKKRSGTTIERLH